MRERLSRLMLGALAAGVIAAGTAAAQDFQKTYALPAGGGVRITNVSGSVTVTGYAGDSIVVAGFKQGKDREQVQIVDNSSADRVDLKVRYPENCNCSVDVNFEVRVPKGVQYNFERLASVSGDVLVTSVAGKLRAESVSGDVQVTDVAGIVSASAVSGDVTVAISRVEGAGDMKFSSVSGDVTVKAPAGLDADVEMSSVSGPLKTDFPIQIHEPRYGPGRSARGRLGGGAHSMRISTVSGRVSLNRI